MVRINIKIKSNVKRNYICLLVCHFPYTTTMSCWFVANSAKEEKARIMQIAKIIFASS